MRRRCSVHANTLIGSASRFDDIAFLAGSGAPAGLYGYMRNVCFGSFSASRDRQKAARSGRFWGEKSAPKRIMPMLA